MSSAFVLSSAQAQYLYEVDEAQFVRVDGMVISPGPPPEKICQLKPSGQVYDMMQQHQRFPGPPQQLLAPGVELEATYVDDCGDQTWPEGGIEAFERAMDIWSTHLESDIPIRIEANWTSLGEEDNGQTLGSASPTRIIRFEAGDRVHEDTWYPVALASAISGQDIIRDRIDDEDHDVVVNMNCDFDNWHFGTGSPSGSVDFMTVVLHEIGHGVGFLGLMSADEEQERATWGLPPQDDEDPLPLIYDRFSEDGEGNALLNEEIYPNPSEALYEALTGQREGVFFDAPSSTFADDGELPELFAPTEWEPGSSYSHVDHQRYTNTEDALMRPFIPRGFRIETPGPIVCGMMSDMGWSVGEDCRDFFEPAVANLQARPMNDVVELTWDSVDGVEAYDVEYISLTDPGQRGYTLAAMDVEAPFEVTVDGLAPGEYIFRVTPVDVRVRSDQVRAFIGIDEPVFVRGPYPSPFQDQTEILFLVDTDQHITISVYDATGRRVAVLFDEFAQAEEAHLRRLNGVELGVGVYFFHMVGETFEMTRSAVLVR